MCVYLNNIIKILCISCFLLFPGLKCIAFDMDTVDLYPSLFDTAAPYVTTKSRGQLGNQLYQAAAGISLALDNNARYIHESRRYPEFFKPFFDKLPKAPTYTFQNRKNGFDYTKNFNPIPFRENMQLDGHFLSYKNFDHHKEVICKLFAPSDEMKSSMKKKYSMIFGENVVVGLHIRTYYHDKGKRTFEQLYQKRPAPNMHYIESAIDCFSPEVLFVVCSDNIEWAKKALKDIDRKFFFSDASFIEDFYLLTLCDHIIIGNSTFSWWAAYLNNSENKIVIAPVPCIFDNRRKIEDAYPPNWVRINRKEDQRLPIFDSDQAYAPWGETE